MGRLLPAVTILFFLIIVVAVSWLFFAEDTSIDIEQAEHSTHITPTRPEASTAFPTSIPNPTTDAVKGGRILGTVLNHSLASMDTLQVRLYARDDEASYVDPDSIALSASGVSEDGTFVIEDVAPGDYYVVAASNSALGLAMARLRSRDRESSVRIEVRESQMLSGRVEKLTGEHLEGATVIPIYSGWPRSSGSDLTERLKLSSYGTKTNAEGQFTLRFPQLTSVRLSATFADFPRKYTDAYKAGMKNIVIVLGAGGLRGTLVDKPNSTPIPEAKLHIQGALEEDVYDITTDPEGSFGVAALGPGVYQASLTHPTFVLYPESMQFTVEEEGDTEVTLAATAGETRKGVELPLIRGILIEGIVIDKEGNPVSGAAVRIRGKFSSSARTESDGRFKCLLPKPIQEAELMVFTKEYATATLENIAVPEEGLSGLEIVLARGASVSGVLVDETGKPVPNERVSLTSEKARREHEMIPYNGPPRSPYIENTTSSNVDSRFQFKRLAEGTYIVEAGQPEIRILSEPNPVQKVMVSEGEAVTDLRVVMTRDKIIQVSVTGQVLDTEGHPIERVQVSINESLSNATTDAEGRFIFNDVQSKTSILSASKTGYTTVETQITNGKRDNVIVTLVREWAIEGQVLDARTRNPITTFDIAKTREQRNYLKNRDFVTVYNREGRFRLNGLKSGSTTIYARVPGYVLGSVTLSDIEEGETVEDIEILLKSGGTLSGKVIDTSGKPIVGAKIMEGEFRDYYSINDTTLTATDEAGRFSVGGLQGGLRSYSAYREGYAPTTFGADTTHNNEVNLVLGVGGIIEGWVTYQGKGIADYIVSLDRFNNRTGDSTKTDAEGYYRFSGLVPETVDLTAMAHSDSSRGRTKRVVVEEGKITEVNFDLGNGIASLTGLVLREGRSVARKTVYLKITGLTGATQEFSDYSDEEGRYIFAALPPGYATGWVSSSPSGHQSVNHFFNIELPENQKTEYNIDTSEASKIVCRLNKPLDVSVINVYLFADQRFELPKTEALLSELHNDAMVWSRAKDGIAEFESVAAGTYTLVGIAYLKERPEFVREIEEVAHFSILSVTVEDNSIASVDMRF